MSEFEKGIFIGKFYPLHLGHIATLQALAKKCQKAFLIFYYDKKAEEKLTSQLRTAYSIDQRVRDAKEAVKEIKNVEVKCVSIPVGITFPADFQKIKKLVEEQIGGIADVQIFGAEEEAIYLPYKYTDKYLLGSPYFIEDEEGRTVPLHATAIRNNYEYYNKYLPASVRITLG